MFYIIMIAIFIAIIMMGVKAVIGLLGILGKALNVLGTILCVVAVLALIGLGAIIIPIIFGIIMAIIHCLPFILGIGIIIFIIRKIKGY